jgi:hypothetical protein
VQVPLAAVVQLRSGLAGESALSGSLVPVISTSTCAPATVAPAVSVTVQVTTCDVPVGLVAVSGSQLSLVPAGACQVLVTVSRGSVVSSMPASAKNPVMLSVPAVAVRV